MFLCVYVSLRLRFFVSMFLCVYVFLNLRMCLCAVVLMGVCAFFLLLSLCHCNLLMNLCVYLIMCFCVYVMYFRNLNKTVYISGNIKSIKKLRNARFIL